MYYIYMPQLHFTIDERTAQRLAAEAKRRRISVSRYVASLVQSAHGDSWPEGYLKGVIGSFRSEPLAVPDELPLDPVDLDGP